MEHRLPLTLRSSHRSRVLVLRAASEAALLEQPSRLPVVPRSGRTMSSLPPGDAISQSLASKSVASGAAKHPLSYASSRAAALALCQRLLVQPAPPSHFVGRPCCPSQPPVPLLPACSASLWPARAMLMGTCLSGATCLRTRLKSLLSPAACPNGPCPAGGLVDFEHAHILRELPALGPR